MFTITIGLDLGDRVSRYCVLDAEGSVVAAGRLPTLLMEVAHAGGPSERYRCWERKLNTSGLRSILRRTQRSPAGLATEPRSQSRVPRPAQTQGYTGAPLPDPQPNGPDEPRRSPQHQDQGASRRSLGYPDGG